MNVKLIEPSPTANKNSVFLVMNPSSHSFKGQAKWPQIFDLLNRADIRFSYEMTRCKGDGIKLAFEASKAGYEIVIAVGGDGTINEVITGLVKAMPSKILTGELPTNKATKFDNTKNSPMVNTKFGVIYTGTSPDFCNFHHISMLPQKVIPAIISGIATPIDLCRVTHKETTSGSKVTRIFSCSSNLGLGAMIARGANSGLRKKWGDELGTFFSMLSAIKHYKPETFLFRINGKERQVSDIYNVFIGKNPLIASGMKLDVDITRDDGKMYIVILHGGSKLRLLATLPRVYTGSICNKFKPIFCKTVEILSLNKTSEIEYDGDPQGTLPAKIEILPSILPLLGRNTA